MALDFPATPAVNQQFSAAGSTWVWDGTAWNLVPQMTPAVINDVPPANPAIGQQWWRSTNGQLYIWVDDGNSKQWVQAASGGAGPGAWEPILSLDFVALTQRDVINLGAFSDLRIRWDALSLASDVSFSLQYSSNNGASFDTAANYINTQLYFLQTPPGVAGQVAQTSTVTVGGSLGASVPSIGNLEIARFNKPSSTPHQGKYATYTSGQQNVQNHIGGYYSSAAVLNAIRFIASGSGVSGHMIIEGVRG